jgi:hypothetical protein
VAVYAQELTRAGIWEAIFAKRVYATNGCRIVLNVTANGVAMGGELVAKIGEDVRFAFTAVLDGYFDHAELVSSGGPIATFIGYDNQISIFTGAHVVRAEPGPMAYYLKVYQTDGGIAWSSPIWVTTSFAQSLGG